jgi:hypothetical protein
MRLVGRRIGMRTGGRPMSSRGIVVIEKAA